MTSPEQEKELSTKTFGDWLLAISRYVCERTVFKTVVTASLNWLPYSRSPNILALADAEPRFVTEMEALELIAGVFEDYSISELSQPDWAWIMILYAMRKNQTDSDLGGSCRDITAASPHLPDLVSITDQFLYYQDYLDESISVPEMLSGIQKSIAMNRPLIESRFNDYFSEETEKGYVIDAMRRKGLLTESAPC
jgi:hypothetical protein